MGNRTDDKRSALLAALVLTEGHVDDLEILWLQSVGALSNHINDAWLEVFALELLAAATGNFNTDAYAYLGALGHTGALPDRWASFWAIILPLIAQKMTVTQYGTDYGDKVDDTLQVILTPDGNTISGFLSVSAGRIALIVSAQDTLDPTITIVDFDGFGNDRVLPMTWHGAGPYYRTGNMAGIRSDLQAELGNSFDLLITWA